MDAAVGRWVFRVRGVGPAARGLAVKASRVCAVALSLVAAHRALAAESVWVMAAEARRGGWSRCLGPAAAVG
jgi:hypothetical protein